METWIKKIMKQKQISMPHHYIIHTDKSYVLGAMPHTLYKFYLAYSL